MTRVTNYISANLCWQAIAKWQLNVNTDLCGAVRFLRHFTRTYNELNAEGTSMGRIDAVVARLNYCPILLCLEQGNNFLFFFFLFLLFSFSKLKAFFPETGAIVCLLSKVKASRIESAVIDTTGQLWEFCNSRYWWGLAGREWLEFAVTENCQLKIASQL